MAFQDTWRALRPTDPQIRTSALHPLWSMIPCHLLSAGVPSAPSGGILSLSVPGTSGLCTPVVTLSLFLKSEPCPGEPILRLPDLRRNQMTLLAADYRPTRRRA